MHEPVRQILIITSAVLEFSTENIFKIADIPYQSTPESQIIESALSFAYYVISNEFETKKELDDFFYSYLEDYLKAGEIENIISQAKSRPAPFSVPELISKCVHNDTVLSAHNDSKRDGFKDGFFTTLAIAIMYVTATYFLAAVRRIDSRDRMLKLQPSVFDLLKPVIDYAANHDIKITKEVLDKKLPLRT